MERVATIRVLFADTDAMGIVYYGNYLRWFEIGRAELMRRKGMAYAGLTETGVHLPVTEAYVRYGSPARYDDTIHVCAAIRELRRASISFAYRIERADGSRLAEGHTVHAFTGPNGKIVPVPRGFREKSGVVGNTGPKGD